MDRNGYIILCHVDYHYPLVFECFTRYPLSNAAEHHSTSKAKLCHCWVHRWAHLRLRGHNFGGGNLRLRRNHQCFGSFGRHHPGRHLPPRRYHLRGHAHSFGFGRMTHLLGRARGHNFGFGRMTQKWRRAGQNQNDRFGTDWLGRATRAPDMRGWVFV